MTSFEDGPAKGQRLMLKRAAQFLRVVMLNGACDALDQPGDTPNPKEQLYAYEIVGAPGHCHINLGGGRGGLYPIATYRLVTPQPMEVQMRSAAAWEKWCRQKDPAAPAETRPVVHATKADYVQSQPQSRPHECHWPGCQRQVPPAFWGCKVHWFKLPAHIRAKIWKVYQPGQEQDLQVSPAYLAAAKEAQAWIAAHS